MKVIDAIKLVQNGQQPIIKFLKDGFDSDGHNKGMKARLLHVSKSEYYDEEGSYQFIFDLKPFEGYNKTLATPDWYDEDHNPTLTWFESDEYPKDGKYVLYLIPGSEEYDDYFDIVDNPVFNKYMSIVADGYKGSYIEWLEGTVNNLLK